MRLNIFSYVNCFWNSSLANLSSNPKSPLLNLRSNYYNSDVELKIYKENVELEFSKLEFHIVKNLVNSSSKQVNFFFNGTRV